MKKLMLLALMCVMTSLFTNNVDSVTTNVAVAETSEFNFADNTYDHDLIFPSITKEDVMNAGGHLDELDKAGEFDYYNLKVVGDVNYLSDQFYKIAREQHLAYFPDVENSMSGIGYRTYKSNLYAVDGEFDITIDLDWYCWYNLLYYFQRGFEYGCTAKIPLLIIDNTPILYANIDTNGEMNYVYRASSFELYGTYNINYMGQLDSYYIPRIKLKWEEKINSISILNRAYTSNSNTPRYNYDPEYLSIGIAKEKEDKVFSYPFEIVSYNVASGVLKLGNWTVIPKSFNQLELLYPKFDKENNITGYSKKTYTSNVIKMEIVDKDGKSTDGYDDNCIVILSGFPMQFTKSCRIQFTSFDFKLIAYSTIYQEINRSWNFEKDFLKDRFSYAYFYDEASGFFQAKVTELFFEDNNAGVVQVNKMSYIPIIGIFNDAVDAYQNKYEWNEQYFIFDMFDMNDEKINNITMIKMKYQKGYWHANKDNLDSSGHPSTYNNDPKNPQKDVRIEDIKVGDFSREELYYTDSHNNRIRKPGLRYYNENLSSADKWGVFWDCASSLFSQIFCGASNDLYLMQGAYFYYNNFRDGQIDNRISYMAPLEIWFFNQELGYTQRLVGNYEGLHVVTDEFGKDIVIDLDGRVRDEYGVGVDPETGGKFVGVDSNGDGVITTDECIDPDLVDRDTTKGDDLDNTNAQTKDDPIAILKRTIGIALGVVGVSIVVILIAKGVTKLRQNRYYRETHRQYKSSKRKRRK
ncbi:MAG: hypothetical protein J1F32_01800 [Erysipelotrichales bacterium]|nr:hypothetical protein [Erysipelotrichales bacterium]